MIGDGSPGRSAAPVDVGKCGHPTPNQRPGAQQQLFGGLRLAPLLPARQFPARIPAMSQSRNKRTRLLIHHAGNGFQCNGCSRQFDHRDRGAAHIRRCDGVPPLAAEEHGGEEGKNNTETGGGGGAAGLFPDAGDFGGGDDDGWGESCTARLLLWQIRNIF